MKKVDEQKHLGIILNTKFSFSAHIKEAISETRKGIGMLKYLSSYLPRHTLNELYKLYVRPHLDYEDVIYHIPAKICAFSQNITLSNMMEICPVFCCTSCDKNMERNISWTKKITNENVLRRAQTERQLMKQIVTRRSFLGYVLRKRGIEYEVVVKNSLQQFKNKIKYWNNEGCDCRLCRQYIPRLGFL